MSALKTRLATITTAPKHIRDTSICSTLTDDLREQYGRRSARVIKGDTVRVMRGEYTGIEGKVQKVDTRRGTLSIEGVQREKIKGGNVKVQIHASNVRLSGLNLDDKYRQNNILGQNHEQDTKKDEVKDNKDNDNKKSNTPNKKAMSKSRSKNKKIRKNTVKDRDLEKEGKNKKKSKSKNKEDGG
ncbi:MAG: 50S ribosomal protein L24 [Nitrososphaeraceae archaeon]